MISRFLGYEVNRYIISSKTANFKANILNLVIFFRSSEFVCESSDFCQDACDSTGWHLAETANHSSKCAFCEL